MIPAPLPDNEALRLQEIDRLACSYAPREERFDRITRTVAELLQVPIALVTVVDEDVQWLRSVQGLGIAHTPRDISFCGHVVAIHKALVIPDTHKDERFHDNPLVTGEPYIRAYAGMPLTLPSGAVVGSLCAIDTMPRTFSAAELRSLATLADIVVSELQKPPLPGLRGQLVGSVPSNVRGEQIDFTTGRWNRAGLLRALDGAMAHARQQSRLALIAIRVAGHDWSRNEGQPLTAEKVLALVSQHLQRVLPEEAVLSRPEPDVFCIVVPGLFEEDVDHLLQALTDDVVLPASRAQPLDLSLSLQCGVTWFDARDLRLEPEDFIAQAVRGVR